MQSFFYALFALSLMAAMPLLQAAPLCRGAGLPHDAPLFYLVSGSITDRGNADEPPERQRIPEKRERLDPLFSRDDVEVFLFSLDTAVERPFRYGVFIGQFRVTDFNRDGIADFFIYEPAGAFYHLMLYAGCGDDFYTPVGAFDSRELPEPVRHVPVNGTNWAEYEVIAPDVGPRHADPLTNWARRTWRFDGKSYRQVEMVPLK